jgi:hypothetical protein
MKKYKLLKKSKIEFLAKHWLEMLCGIRSEFVSRR